MSYNVSITESYDGEEISENYIGTTNMSEAIEQLFGLPARSYANNDDIHDAIQTDTFEQNWLKFRIWSLRQIQLHADDLLAEFDDLDDNQIKMINELKAHTDTFTVGDVKEYNDSLTDLMECPLAGSWIILGNSGIEGADVALMLNYVGNLIRDPNHVEVSFD